MEWFFEKTLQTRKEIMRKQPKEQNPMILDKDLTFEAALEKLEAIVERLERAEAPLEQALAFYEEGVALSRFCSEQLKYAERKVELLEDQNGELTGRPFAESRGGENDTAPEADNTVEEEEGGGDAERLPARKRNQPNLFES